MSLYLKYRPKDFKNLVGQDHIKHTILGALKGNVLAHAYLFYGPRGTGKTTVARLIAKAINCLSPLDDHAPCNTCDMCTMANNNTLVDLIEIDAASNRSIDDIRDLREKVQFSPNMARAKIYIIDEVHMLTKEAFNALLKTLEEPPENVYFILATTESHKVPETIISRCQQFAFQRIPLESLIQRLEFIAKEEGISIERDAIRLIAQASEGGLRDAIGLLDQLRGDEDITEEYVRENLGLVGDIILREFFEAILQQQTLQALQILSQIVTEGQSLTQFSKEFLLLAREEMLKTIQEGGNANSIVRIIEIFSQASRNIKNAIILSLPLEIAIIEACETEEQPSQKTASSHSEEPKKAGFFGFGKSEQTTEQTKEESPKEQPVSKPASPPPEKREKKELPPSNDATTLLPELSLEIIQQKWNLVADVIPTSLVRIAFKSSNPLKVVGKKITITSTSESYLNRISDSRGTGELIMAFEKIFGQRVEIATEMMEVTLEPLIKASTPPPQGKTLSDMAKEVFGD